MFVIILSQCILKRNRFYLDEHVKKFVPNSAECEYHIYFRAEEKDKPLGTATNYHPTQVKIYEEIEEFGKDRYIFYGIDKLTIITFNSIKNFNPNIYEKFISKPMLMNRMLVLIDKNPDGLKVWGCNKISIKSPCYCKNNDPATRYVWYKIYK